MFFVILKIFKNAKLTRALCRINSETSRVWKVACTQKLWNVHKKNVHLNLEITLISEILEIYFTETFCYCFIETSFVVHSLFFGERRRYVYYFSDVRV